MSGDGNEKKGMVVETRDLDGTLQAYEGGGDCSPGYAFSSCAWWCEKLSYGGGGDTGAGGGATWGTG